MQPAGLGAVVEDDGEDVELELKDDVQTNKVSEDDGECEACTI